MEINQITGQIVDSAFQVHSTLGPGLLEHVYLSCLKYELLSHGLTVQSELALPVTYKNQIIDLGYRLDLLVNSQVIVELKAVDAIAPIHKAQILTYLKLANLKIGLLINFNSTLIKNGIVRVIL